MRTKSLEAALLLGAALSSVGCGQAESELDTEVRQSSQALTPIQPFVRPNIHELTPAQRTTLANAILAFITQPVLDEHSAGHDWHHPAVGELFFIRHHDYLNQLESYLFDNGFGEFLPLPEWDPAEPIPAEFLVADPLVTQAAMNPTPDLPRPARFEDSELCSFSSASALAEELEGWHDDVHVTVGGAMGSIPSAPGAPIFWLWHALVDDTYHERAWRCETLPALVLTVI